MRYLIPTLAGIAGLLIGLLHEGPDVALARPHPDAEVLIVGDSQAWGWTFDGVDSLARMGRVHVLGIPSYTAARLEREAGQLEGSKAHAVILQIGTADVSVSSDWSQIATDVLDAVDAIHEALPGAHIVVVRLPNRTDPQNAEVTRMVNVALRAGLDGVPYARFVLVNLHPGPDGVHIDAVGYARLAAVLQ